MKFDIDEAFNFVFQKNWWIWCLLSLPGAYYNIQSYGLQSSSNPSTISTFVGISILSFICYLVFSGFINDYIKKRAHDVYYVSESLNIGYFLVLRLKNFVFYIGLLILMFFICLIPLGLLVAIIAKLVSTLFLIIAFPLAIILYFFFFSYVITGYLLLCETQKISSCLKIITIFKLLKNNFGVILKLFGWGLLITLPISIFISSLLFIIKIQYVLIPIFAFAGYAIWIIWGNLLAQALSNISKDM